MRREALATVAVVAGLGLAGLSALAGQDGPAGAGPDARTPSTTTISGLFVPKRQQVEPRQLQPRPTQGRGSGTVQPVRDLQTETPERLVLPSIGVSAAVSPIGTDGSRILVPPSDYTTVGWWSQGAEPGDGQGTTILAGHTVHTGGGALDNLGDVKVGDTVVVDRARQDLRYDVTSVTTYRKGTLAARAGEVFRQDGPERVAIVTCGDWNGEIYLSNVVVIATNPQPVSPA